MKIKSYICTMNNLIQHNIKKILRSQDKELKDLYVILGISRSSYYSRVTGNITINNLQQIADALGCRVVDLLIEPCEQIVSADCANNEPIISNLIECPNCKQKLYVHAINDIK